MRISYLFTLTVLIILAYNIIVNYPRNTIKHKEQRIKRYERVEISSNRTKLYSNKINNANCTDITYDPSEWTLTLRKSIGNDRICQKTYNSIIKGKNVKRISYANQSKIINHGCTANTSKCNETAHFNYNLNIRVNTPPCCREKIIKILEHLTKELQYFHITHVLAFGGVLGWIRNGKLIPYDHDLDVIVDGKFWKTKLFWNVIKILKVRYGHTYEMRDKDMKLTISYSLNNSNSIDVWPYNVSDIGKFECPTVIVPHYDWKVQPLSNLFPAQYVVFENIWTYIPRKPVLYLNILYGENWMEELNCKKIRDGKCAPLIRRRTHKPYGFVGFMFLILFLMCLIVLLINNRSHRIQARISRYPIP